MSTVAENLVNESTTSITSTTTVAGFVIIASTLYAYYYWQENKRYFELGKKLPGPSLLWLLKEWVFTISFFRPSEMLLKALQLQETYGKIMKAWAGLSLYVGLIHPDDVEVILSSHDHLDKADEYQWFQPWLGDGLLINSGDKWRTHRKMIAPTFHMNILKSFIDIFNERSRGVVKDMAHEIGKTFDVHEYMSGITVDILLETAMGVKKTYSNNAGLKYAIAVMKMCDILHQRHYKIWLRSDFLFNLTQKAKKQLEYLGIIHGLTDKVIEIKKETYKENRLEGSDEDYFKQLNTQAEKRDKAEAEIAARKGKNQVVSGLRDDLDDIDENDIGEKKRLAFLDLMIETTQNSDHLTDKDIRDEVNTIMFEGHDTTAAGSSFVLSVLGWHHDIQDRVYQELYEIFGDSDRPVTYLDTLEMKYLERVIFETLRMFPPVPLIARKLKQEVKLASNKNYTLPKGTTVLIGILKIHRDTENYAKPDEFNPDNFLPEVANKRHYYSFIPFSAGPRSCVGRKYAMLKLKILLATILRNYRVICETNPKDFSLIGDVILKRADGFDLKIEPRNKIVTTKG